MHTPSHKRTTHPPPQSEDRCAYIHTNKQPHPPARPTPRDKPTGEDRPFDAATRCSRPLSRSQTTTPHPNPHTTTPKSGLRMDVGAGSPEAPAPPEPSQVLSGGLILQNPNSVSANEQNMVCFHLAKQHQPPPHERHRHSARTR